MYTVVFRDGKAAEITASRFEFSMDRQWVTFKSATDKHVFTVAADEVRSIRSKD